MFPLCSFLQSVCRFVKAFIAPAVSVTKRMYRSFAVILAGTVVVAVMTFASVGFAGGGRSALTAYAETFPGETDGDEEVTEDLESGQQLAGNTLAKNVQDELAARQARRDAIKEAKEEIRQVEEERQRIASKEERKEKEEALHASSVISYSDSDYELFKRIVEAEAGVCDTKGRILVANVIINRVKSNEFPNNITDVVYQKSQFSPVYDGRLYSCKVTEKTVEAVNRALAGEDYSQGALYFMNRERSQAHNVSWFDRRLTYLFQHDRHEFFK